MYDYISGIIVELTPAELVIECSGIGYSILISLQTFEALQGKETAKVFVYHHLREDEESFYGFATKDERELFKLLIGVSGIGVGSARMMLSSLTDEEIRKAILSEDVNKIKSVKGIGLKSAQRLILELKDKIAKGGGVQTELFSSNQALLEEASAALLMLGFSKPAIGKVVPEIIKAHPDARIEEIIKLSLQKL